MQQESFQWDEKKNKENQLKHNISFEEAQYAFKDPNKIITEDLEHSKKEKRYFCLGKIHDKIVTVRFTYRGKYIRIFGAGYWRRGKKRYEQEQKS